MRASVTGVTVFRVERYCAGVWAVVADSLTEKLLHLNLIDCRYSQLDKCSLDQEVLK